MYKNIKNFPVSLTGKSGRGGRTRTLKNGFGDRHVTITSHPCIQFKYGGPSGTRTPDRPVMSRLLYQLS